MATLRMSAISFLNTAPLMWDFEHGDAARDFAIEYTIPSACAAALAANQADIGIIPAITYAEIPGLLILPNIAIAAKDFVRSILLVSKKPIEEIERLPPTLHRGPRLRCCRSCSPSFSEGPTIHAAHPATGVDAAKS